MSTVWPCVGSQCIAARAQIELAFDSLRSQGEALSACIGLSDGIVQQATESNQHPAKSLLKDIKSTWSTMVMQTTPFPANLLQDIHPNHQVLLSRKPHRPGCHQWRPAQTTLATEIRELQPDVIVECYLNAKYYQYDPVDLRRVCRFNETVEEDDNIMTVKKAEMDGCPCPSMTTSRSLSPHVQNGTRTHQRSISNGSNTTSQVI